MANHLQGIALLALAANAWTADFSHRAHLALKLECTTCHASVTKSSRVEDNNLPKAEACIACHNPAPPD
ncbi:MAG TPA: cytochrome c3 family protein [Bryobacteraceae bacterium]|nr:cytochrome c3 family protein [Bryobacteraceae bacterium]